MGGSESRFVVRQESTGKYLTQTPGSHVGDPVGYYPRDITNGYQKIIVTMAGKFASLRYDMHPQNYIGMHEGRLVMLGTFCEETQWKVLILQKRDSSEVGENSWHELGEEDLSLDWDVNQGKTLKVVLFHPATKSLLNYVDTQGFPGHFMIPKGKLDSLGQRFFPISKASDLSLKLSTTVWSMECVDHNIKASTGMIKADTIPIITVGARHTGDIPVSAFAILEASPVVVLSPATFRADAGGHGGDVGLERLECLIFESGFDP